MRRVIPVAVAGASVALATCGGGDSRSAVIVSAASSLEPAFTAYAEGAGIEAKQSFAGSDELAAQIRAGARPDLFAAADVALLEQLEAEGLVEGPVVFASNRLVLAVAAGESAVRSLHDLADHGGSLAIGDPEVPIGAYTREVLAGLRPAEAEAILARVGSEEPDVAGIVGKLSQGAVDAGFVYVTDVVATDRALEAIELPERLQPSVAYGAAVVSDAEHAEEARRFIEGLLGGVGAEALREAGFGQPPA